MIRAFYLLPLLALGLAACEPAPGPAQRAGQSLDRAADAVRDAVDPPSGPVERAGRAVDRATR
ncbi:hypothetical protein [Sediminicoccus sp. KRV36]|uniref:hypothetical protein n=1 Tax=Sediminicoccus sp. KRV36 TaxID=3133721 RepID=UPI00200F010B|nr:hypothetical protein [Sediminicoccus rosea]UPY36454.1 hypothetical protein LHU95_19875 [Sediminicoccus rosea]